MNNILNNPELFNILTNEIGKKVVGERETIKTLLLCSAGTLVNNSQISSYNLLVNDESGIGKDFVSAAVVNIFPDEWTLKRTRISPMTFTYWKAPYKDKKTEKMVNEDWTWDGKIVLLHDIADNVLNNEVFKCMCSEGTYATIVKKQVAYDKEIKGKPVMIITSANATPNPELASRFIIVNLDPSAEQTKRIKQRQAEKAIKGVKVKYDKDIVNSLKELERVNVVIPYADKLINVFPDNTGIRRHFDRWLDLIRAATALHQKQRKTDSDGNYIANKQDYNIAREVLLKITSNPYMIPLTRNQRILLEFLKDNDDAMDIHEIASKCSAYSKAHLYNVLPDLQKYGFIKSRIQDNEDTRRQKQVFWFNLDMDLTGVPIPTAEELGIE